MTDEELKQKAIKASDKKCVKGCSKYYRYGFQDGYIAGATENGIVWHDLRKDPNDLPTKLSNNKRYSIRVLTCFDRRQPSRTGFYNHCSRQWEDETEHVTYAPIAWAELPLFKE